MANEKISTMVNIFDIIFLSTQTLLLILFLIQIRVNNRSATYLLSAMTFGIIATTLSITRTYMTVRVLDRGVLALQLICYGIEYILIYQHFHGTISDKVDLIQTFTIAFIFGIHTAYGLYYTFSTLNDLSELLWDVSYNILGFVVFLYVTYCLFRAFSHTRENSALLQVTAAVLIALGFFGAIFQTPSIAKQLSFEISTVMTELLKSVGIFLILIVYIINPDFIERLPVQTFGIMTFDKGGNTISYHQIKSRGVFEDISLKSEANLITALTKAILSFIQQALGTKTDLNRIEAEDKLIMFNIGDEIGVAVIAEQGTDILHQSIRRCQSQLDREIGSEVKKGLVDPPKIKRIISNSFPYIVFT